VVIYTLEQMRAEVQDSCEIEGGNAPSSEVTTRMLNRAKNEIVAQIEVLNQGHFTQRKTFTVAAGDASITLPDGSTSDLAVRRILGLTRTDLTADVECIIHPQWDRDKFNYADLDAISYQPRLYREGYKLYFTDRGGAAQAMTLVLRYAAAVLDLDQTDLTAKYTMIPDEWMDLITMYATLLCLPANNAGRKKYLDMYMARLETMREVVQRSTLTQPSSIEAYGGF